VQQRSHPIDGLYLGGGGVYPGIPGSLGGYNAARVVCSDLGLERWWPDPASVEHAREVGLLPEVRIRVSRRHSLAKSGVVVRGGCPDGEKVRPMRAKENLELIEELQQAARDRDFDRYGALLTDDAVFRMAGVPASMGGVTTGRQAVVDQFRATAGDSTFALKQMFGDDKHVCVIGRVAAERLPGNAYLQGADHPYSTYECVVYRIANSRVAESTAYINWLDPYVQTGLVDASNLTT
jgi:ketosteroid isomerase-like protein